MGMILQFRQPDTGQKTASDVQASLKNRGKQSAEIIIFPGVRIERQADVEASDAKPVRRKRNKKTARRKV